MLLIPAVAVVTRLDITVRYCVGPRGLFLDRPCPGQARMRIRRSYKPVGHLSTDVTVLMLVLDGKYSFQCVAMNPKGFLEITARVKTETRKMCCKNYNVLLCYEGLVPLGGYRVLSCILFCHFPDS